MIAEQERIDRLAVIASALASQRMEGLEPDAKVVQDAHKWATGDLSIASAIEDYKARLARLQHEPA